MDKHEFKLAADVMTQSYENIRANLSPITCKIICEINDNIKSSFQQLVRIPEMPKIPDFSHVWKQVSSFAGAMEGIKRYTTNLLLLAERLPERGWYMSGRERCTSIAEMAEHIKNNSWDEVDEIFIHCPLMKKEALRDWLVVVEAPECCINRIELFLEKYDAGEHEVATYVGIPMLDELSFNLYGKGRDFTCKHGRGKPGMAHSTPNDKADVCGFNSKFVEKVGSLQEDTDKTRLEDENYWNRHAILHGLMNRPMGIKDSSKCLAAMKFLIFAREELGPPDLDRREERF